MTLRSRCLTFIDWFVPPNLKDDRAMLGRARIFTVTHLFGPLLGALICGFLYIADPHPGTPFVIIAVSISGFSLLPFGLKFFGQLPIIAFVSFADLTFATLYGSYYYGGVSSPFLPWLLVALLLGFFYLGQRPFLVIGYFAANIAGFIVAYMLNGGFPDRVPLAALSPVGISSVVSATVYVSIMAFYYANAVASQSEFAEEAQRYSSEAVRMHEAMTIAESANRAKSVFLAKMSHQLRTPLNAVIGYSEMLLEDAETEGQREHIADLRRINGAGKHLLSLVTDVLDMSAIEADRMELTMAPFDLADFVDDVAATSRSLFTAKSNEFRVERASDLGVVMSDPTRLRQMTLNLLSNAGKFTVDGVVLLRVTRDNAGTSDWVKLSVYDTGIGISRDNLGRLFQDFNQAEASTATLYGGTGLGLALSRKIARMMGGDITVTSELGKGSCFTINVPAYVATRTAAQPGDDVADEIEPARETYAA
ncbi:MAG: sensor histidine kinase [Stellaceae bacterium]